MKKLLSAVIAMALFTACHADQTQTAANVLVVAAKAQYGSNYASASLSAVSRAISDGGTSQSCEQLDESVSDAAGSLVFFASAEHGPDYVPAVMQALSVSLSTSAK